MSAAAAPASHQLVETPVSAGTAELAVRTVRAPFDRMREASRREPAPDYAERQARLGTLLAMVRDHQREIEEAISADFGGRSCHETRLAEIFVTVEGIKYVQANLRRWMRPRSRGVAWMFRPGRARIVHQPLGVVGVIAPWNYPFQLAMGPATYALAAGNRVLIKPSELTPRISELMARLVGKCFAPEVMSVVTGGADVGAAFSRLPFDHLLFTGSTHVGRIVMKAAAENLVPVTLELGGKSPAIVHESFSVERAATRIAAGKWLNAGQTCIAPDYVLAPESRQAALVEALVAATRKSYPTIADNADYTSVISPRHYDRLRDLLRDAEQRGAKSVVAAGAGEAIPESAHRLPPTLILGVTEEMKVMQEEIFGPLLPIVTYRTLDEAISYVNEHPRPLALYYFDEDRARAEQVLSRTTSGGAAVNETMFHFAVDDIPFGGVGPSGMGAYHGFEGFETFSHKKGVFSQPRWNAAFLLSPPYGTRFERLVKLFIGK